jgi:phage shock protein C
MFCPQCGKEYTQKVNFCSQCGTAMVAPTRLRKKLMRSRTDEKIAGVCGGFAEYFDMDPTLMRLLWLALILVGGWGVIAYFVAWIVMPEEPAQQAAPVTTTAAQPASHA